MLSRGEHNIIMPRRCVRERDARIGAEQRFLGGRHDKIQRMAPLRETQPSSGEEEEIIGCPKPPRDGGIEAASNE
jgi:hypothetical protein